MPTRKPGEIRRDNQPEHLPLAGRDARNFGHHEWRIKSNHDHQPAVEPSNGWGKNERPHSNESAAPGSDKDGRGPYNRGGQFEATELNGDSPSTQISRGARKRDQEDWQDEARNPVSHSSEKK